MVLHRALHSRGPGPGPGTEGGWDQGPLQVRGSARTLFGVGGEQQGPVQGCTLCGKTGATKNITFSLLRWRGVTLARKASH